jgi:SAM-dependent methyltransferase
MNEYDRDFWEQRWTQALRAHGDRVAQRQPNAHLTAEIGDLRPGRALDAGCGNGSETLWLAARGWQVTAGDFAATALAHAGATADGDVGSHGGKLDGNTFRSTGRIGGQRIKPGRYELVATPRANGQTGHAVRARFRVVR